jgi:hypothetical protein
MNKQTTTVEAEQAVRRYFQMISDPDSLRDDVAVRQLERELAATTDPIERLLLFSAIDRAKTVDTQGIRGEFHRRAKSFAEANGITASAFSAMGASKEDLRLAGLLGQTSSSRTGSLAQPRSGGRRSSVDDVVAAVPADVFTSRRLEELSGASTLTVRKALDRLLASGQLVEMDPDPAYPGPGRAPRRYVRA